MAAGRANPFPGMNPYLEQVWPGVHTLLITFMCEALAGEIPDDLVVRPEEALAITTVDANEQRYRADVAVSGAWRSAGGDRWAAPEAADGIMLAKPVVVMAEEITERWVEIRTAAGELVTVIEILSPANKGPGRSEYRRKQQRLLEGRVNLVEIDLLRGGESVVAVAPALIPWRNDRSVIGTICVTRAGERRTHELYACALRERLPAFGVPLRPSDQDAPLDLQPLLDRAYETGSYWRHDFTLPLDPPLGQDDARWVSDRLAAAGIAG